MQGQGVGGPRAPETCQASSSSWGCCVIGFLSLDEPPQPLPTQCPEAASSGGLPESSVLFVRAPVGEFRVHPEPRPSTLSLSQHAEPIPAPPSLSPAPRACHSTLSLSPAPRARPSTPSLSQHPEPVPAPRACPLPVLIPPLILHFRCISSLWVWPAVQLQPVGVCRMKTQQ